MFKYVNFQIMTFCKKKANQYFSLTSVLTILILNSIVATLTVDFITVDNIQNNILAFSLSSIYTLLTIMHVYSQGEEDGTELLFSTKSISRTNLYIGKALASIFLIFSFTVALLLVNWIPAVISSGDSSHRASYVFSQFFGGFCVQLILFLIFAFVATISNKMKTLISMLLTIVFFPVFTIIAAPITSGQPSELTSINSVGYIYTDGKLMKDVPYIDTYTTTIEREFEVYSDNETYSSIAAIDIWNQFNGMMNIFNTTEKYNTTAIQKWEETTIRTPSDIHGVPSHTENQNELIFPVLSEDALSDINLDFTNIIKSIDSWLNDFGNNNTDHINQVSTWSDLFIGSNVMQRMKFIQYFSEGADRTSDTQRESMYQAIFENTRTISIEYLNNIEAKSALIYSEFLESNSYFTDLVEPTEIFNYATNKQALIGDFVIGNQTMSVYASGEYINTWASLSMLLTLSMTLFIIGGIVYNWKDFK